MLPPDRAVFVLQDKEVTQDSGCGAKQFAAFLFIFRLWDLYKELILWGLHF